MSTYREFIQKHIKSAEFDGMPMKERMKALGAKWREMKEGGEMPKSKMPKSKAKKAMSGGDLSALIKSMDEAQGRGEHWNPQMMWVDRSGKPVPLPMSGGALDKPKRTRRMAMAKEHFVPPSVPVDREYSAMTDVFEPTLTTHERQVMGVRMMPSDYEQGRGMIASNTMRTGGDMRYGDVDTKVKGGALHISHALHALGVGMPHRFKDAPIDAKLSKARRMRLHAHLVKHLGKEHADALLQGGSIGDWFRSIGNKFVEGAKTFASGVATPFRLASAIGLPSFGIDKIADKLGVPTIQEVISK